jgi:hypothetical protein
VLLVDDVNMMLTMSFNVLPATAAGCTCRQLTGMLPSLQTIPVRDAPSTACLHLQSASHLQATMPLIAPQAFAAIQSADAAALADESPTAADLVAKVTEIQLFHLTRVRAVSTYMRAHIANRERQAADAAPNGPDTEMTSRSQEVANSTGSQEEPRSMH